MNNSRTSLHRIARIIVVGLYSYITTGVRWALERSEPVSTLVMARRVLSSITGIQDAKLECFYTLPTLNYWHLKRTFQC